MSIFIGLRFDEESTNILAKWMRECSEREATDCILVDFTPVAPQKISIPLVYCDSERLDDFESLGKMDRIVELKDPWIKNYGGHWNALALAFHCDWIKARREELVEAGFKRRYKFQCHINMAFKCHNVDMRWLDTLPTRQLRVIEEFATPFNRYFPHQAHVAA